MIIDLCDLLYSPDFMTILIMELCNKGFKPFGHNSWQLKEGAQRMRRAPVRESVSSLSVSASSYLISDRARARQGFGL